MPGLPGTAPAPDLPSGPRLALIIATATYHDQGLRQLRAPARDAEDLAQVLADPAVGGFAVTTVVDESAQNIRLAVEDFLTERGTQDLLLLYLSCHGLLDQHRRLYFAANDTRKDRLAATGVEAAWVLDQLEHCRARRQVLVLDACFSGAFARGAKGDTSVGLQDRFAGHGRGRVVLTASNDTEYSFEGDLVATASAQGSVFTAALVAGLRTGAADADGDGYISVDDAYAYTFDHVRACGAAQTPQRWFYGAEGKIVLARSAAGRAVTPAPLPESVRVALESPLPGVRAGAVRELGEWLSSGDPAKVLAAAGVLREVASADIPQVTELARAYLREQVPESSEMAFISVAEAGHTPEGSLVVKSPESGSRDFVREQDSQVLQRSWLLIAYLIPVIFLMIGYLLPNAGPLKGDLFPFKFAAYTGFPALLLLGLIARDRSIRMNAMQSLEVWIVAVPAVVLGRLSYVYFHKQTSSVSLYEQWQHTGTLLLVFSVIFAVMSSGLLLFCLIFTADNRQPRIAGLSKMARWLASGRIR